jgi:hypothetical protein
MFSTINSGAAYGASGELFNESQATDFSKCSFEELMGEEDQFGKKAEIGLVMGLWVGW